LGASSPPAKTRFSNLAGKLVSERVLTASSDNTARLWEADSGQLLATALAETFDTVSDSGLLHVFSDQDMEGLIRSVHAVLRPSGLYWLMCFSEHATFPGPRRLTQQHIATLFKEGWQIRSIEHARFEVIAGRGEDEGKIAAAWLAGIERL